MPYLKFEIQELPELSKNKKYYFRNRGTRRIKKEEFCEAMEFLTTKIKILVNKSKLSFTPKQKVHITFIHKRKNARSDCHNFCEAVCDAIKEAIGVNDNYYSTFFDYEDLNKKEISEPSFIITIDQKDSNGCKRQEPTN